MKRFLLPIMASIMSLYAIADDTVKSITWPNGSSHNVVPVLSMKVTVDGTTERSFCFGSYNNEDYFAVDFGDGTLVVTDSIGHATDTATKNAATGVAKGEGMITVYAENADNVWYISTSTGTSTTSPIETIDVSKLKKAHQMSFGGVIASTIDLSACDSLRTFTSAKGALTSMDFSNNPEVTSINLTDNKLTSLNVSKNSKLDQLSIYNNELTALDLSTNAALTGIYAYSNKIASVKFADGATFKTVNLQDNALTEIALPAISGSSSMLYLNKNALTELTVPTSVGTFEATDNKLAKISLVDCTKSCKLENNCFSIATLPTKPVSLNSASKIKKFTYAPQAPLAVEAEVNGTLDLSAQLKAMGELETEAVTNYSFADAEGNALTEGTDYVVNNGVASFLKKFDNIHAVMTTEAFPKAVDALAFVSTSFNVTGIADAIADVNADDANAATYNINGIKIASPEKGINIRAGKKIYVK